MALQQVYTNPITGSEADYHRISLANVDYMTKQATITVLSYFNQKMRDKEKSEDETATDNTARTERKRELLDRINELLGNPAEENEAERKEISAQLQAINEEEDAAKYVEPVSRFMYSAEYIIPMDSADDYTLKYAYEWLKANIFTDSKDV